MPIPIGEKYDAEIRVDHGSVILADRTRHILGDGPRMLSVTFTYKYPRVTSKTCAI